MFYSVRCADSNPLSSVVHRQKLSSAYQLINCSMNWSFDNIDTASVRAQLVIGIAGSG